MARGSKEKEQFLKKLGTKYARELTQKATKWELEFKEILEEAGLEFYFQYPVVCNKNFLYILDFYLPAYHLAFELDGAQHFTTEGQKNDAKRTRRLEKLGLRVKRIRNSSVKQVTVKMILDYLKPLLKS